MSHYNNQYPYVIPHHFVCQDNVNNRVPQVPHAPEINIPTIFFENNGYNHSTPTFTHSHTSNYQYNEKANTKTPYDHSGLVQHSQEPVELNRHQVHQRTVDPMNQVHQRTVPIQFPLPVKFQQVPANEVPDVQIIKIPMVTQSILQPNIQQAQQSILQPNIQQVQQSILQPNIQQVQQSIPVPEKSQEQAVMEYSIVLPYNQNIDQFTNYNMGPMAYYNIH